MGGGDGPPGMKPSRLNQLVGKKSLKEELVRNFRGFTLNQTTGSLKLKLKLRCQICTIKKILGRMPSANCVRCTAQGRQSRPCSHLRFFSLFFQASLPLQDLPDAAGRKMFILCSPGERMGVPAPNTLAPAAHSSANSSRGW